MAKRTKAETAAVSRRFGENLFTYRRRSGQSQVNVAERSGVHTTEISRIEKGKVSPRLDTIVKLAGAIEVEPCELLAGMSWRRPRRASPGRTGYLSAGASEDGAAAARSEAS